MHRSLREHIRWLPTVTDAVSRKAVRHALREVFTHRDLLDSCLAESGIKPRRPDFRRVPDVRRYRTHADLERAAVGCIGVGDSRTAALTMRSPRMPADDLPLMAGGSCVPAILRGPEGRG